MFQNDALCIQWWIKPQSELEFVVFFFIQHLYMLEKIIKATRWCQWWPEMIRLALPKM